MKQYLVKIKNHKFNKRVEAKVIAADPAEARGLAIDEAAKVICRFANPFHYKDEWRQWGDWDKEHLPDFSDSYWKNAEYIVVELNTNIISLNWDNL